MAKLISKEFILCELGRTRFEAEEKNVAQRFEKFLLFLLSTRITRDWWDSNPRPQDSSGRYTIATSSVRRVYSQRSLASATQLMRVQIVAAA